MAMPWIDNIKKPNRLSVYSGSLEGAWSALFREALQNFNALSRTHVLGVTMTQSKDAPTDSGGANVGVQAGNGQISSTYAKEEKAEFFDGRRMHGRTFLFSRDGKIEKAFIFLPSQPQINTPWGVRGVGTNIMKLIAVHELVHACGLTNAEHSKDDLFQANPTVDPGTTPAKDRVLIRMGNRDIWMPPLILSGSTVRHIQQLWN